MRDILEGFFIIVGSFFLVTSALGALRFPDFYTRMHSTGKVSSFGIGFYLLALVVKYPEFSIMVKAFLCLFFIVLTTPLSAQMLMRAAYLLDVPRTKRGSVDQYRKQIHPNPEIEVEI
jgi:multicomponent Na+:H+ antiporter subunit G